MKKLKSLPKYAAMVALALAFTACSDDDDDYYVMHLDNSGIQYNAEGYWTGCYNTSTGDVQVNDVMLSHEATDWGEWGVTWYGFCPSKVSDTADYSTGVWTQHQWASITGGGLAGKGSPYIIGFWNNSESGDAPYSCSITLKDGVQFRPEQVYVTNNTYAYYLMRNGSAFNMAFTADDWCKLHIKGVHEGAFTGEVEVYLAKGTDILDEWKYVDLSGLGWVDGLVFTMSSSDTGQWGMNNPSYFCLDMLTYTLNK